MPRYLRRPYDPCLPFPAVIRGCRMTVALLRGEEQKIQAYLDDWFEDATDGEYRVWAPLGDQVYLAFNHGRLGVEGDEPLSFGNYGSTTYKESALFIPILVAKRTRRGSESFTELLPWAACDMAYIWADSIQSVCTARYTWGFSKSYGTTEVREDIRNRPYDIEHRTLAKDLAAPDQTDHRHASPVYALRRHRRDEHDLFGTDATGLDATMPKRALQIITGHEHGVLDILVDHRGGLCCTHDHHHLGRDLALEHIAELGEGLVVGPAGAMKRPVEEASSRLRAFLDSTTLDERLLAGLSKGVSDGIARFRWPMNRLLDLLPTDVIALKQVPNPDDGRRADLRQLVRGQIACQNLADIRYYGPGSWSFTAPDADSPHRQPYQDDLGLESQEVDLVVDIGLDMRVLPAEVVWQPDTA